MLGNITQSLMLSGNLTDGLKFVANTSFGGYTYQTNIRFVAGLIPDTNIGINHNMTVPVDGINAVDGLVAVLTAHIVDQPRNATSQSESFFLDLDICVLTDVLFFACL